MNQKEKAALKQRTFRHRKKERMVYVMGGKCQICGYDRCLRALEFHHINPKEKDFTLSSANNINWDDTCEELQKCILVCSNCHEEIHAGIVKSSILKSSYDKNKAKEISNQILETKEGANNKYCSKCGRKLSKENESGYCQNCIVEERRKYRPSREQLKKEIRECSFVSLGKKYGISDNAVRKWCEIYNLPKQKRIINSYTNEEWEEI